jgi:hypothetical protein
LASASTFMDFIRRIQPMTATRPGRFYRGAVAGATADGPVGLARIPGRTHGAEHRPVGRLRFLAATRVHQLFGECFFGDE